MNGIKRIEIYERGIEVLADVHYFGGDEETVVWNRTDERVDILRKIDGYTYIEDMRI